MKNLELKHKQLEVLLAEMGEVIVAFSGGVDSALLAKVAFEVLGTNARITTAISDSLAEDELAHCRNLAEEWGFKLQEVNTAEMSEQQYRENGLDRCYWCKAALMDAFSGIRENNEIIVLGVNTDDLADHRPGILAAEERGARFPLLEAELSKKDIRSLSEKMGLKTWDKPAAPCLASRVPYGMEVSTETLRQIDRAESALKNLGFGDLRVRHHDETARIEVPETDFQKVLTQRETIVDAVKAAGYRFVVLDLEGLRSGGLLPIRENVHLKLQLGKSGGGKSGK